MGETTSVHLHIIISYICYCLDSEDWFPNHLPTLKLNVEITLVNVLKWSYC